MAKVVVMDHPLIQHKIGFIRREDTGTKDFRQTISEIAMLICYEATRDLKLDDVAIKTPICETTVKELRGKKMAIIPILRAGLGMVDGVLTLIPAAKVGHIGLYRDPETLKPVEYYCNAFGSSDDTHEMNILAALVLEHLNCCDRRTAGSQHGIYNEYFSVCAVCGKRAVILNRL